MALATTLMDSMRLLDSLEPMRWTGVVTQVIGLLVSSRGPCVSMGDLCEISTNERRAVKAQVIGFKNGEVLLMPLEPIHGLQPGNQVIARGNEARVGVGMDLLGRILDGFGKPMDSGSALRPAKQYVLDAIPPSPLDRRHIDRKLATGVRAIDSLLTCGKGQRIGVFGGSGVGKSTLLASMARYTEADVNVIALIGERSREVTEFIDHELGKDGLKRSVVVVATSDQPATLRVRACFLAMAIAEYFRDEGKDVLFVMDSVTRLAMAQREISLAAGEPPSQKGYTPSVFQMLLRLFERAGNFQNGSITGFFAVLVEGDDFNEPICDAVRAILDGHVILSRELAAGGHYPAIDILNSVSRLAGRLCQPAHSGAANTLRKWLSTYDASRELVQLGAYVAGTNPQLDEALRVRPQLLAYLQQDWRERAAPEETEMRLIQLAGGKQ